MTDKNPINISAEMTPNPNTVKFIVEKNIVDSGHFNFPNKEKARGSLLPETLFDLAGITGVMVGPNFVSVTKEQELEWENLANPVYNAIQDAFEKTGQLISDDARTKHQSQGEDSETVKQIKDILDNQIRPAVAQDGGDITFHSYEDGILTLYLQGACTGCPSATITLKAGIENHLKQLIPDLKEVIQL
ncbi:MAG: NifU family protein [bacterium]|nr:NifU family protein [bacterium]